MNYIKLEMELLNEIDWRVSELGIIKTLPLKRTLNKNQKGVMEKYAIPNIYSIWEGFVKVAFRIYINELNSLRLSHTIINHKILVHSLDTKFPQITTGVSNNFPSKCDFVDKFHKYTALPIVIDTKLPTESNINWDVINKLLDRFNLQNLPERPFKKQLNELLKVRNHFAHGESSRPVNQNLIDDNVKLVVTLMDEVMYRILDGCKNKLYEK